jgi:hypothetical protein
MSRANKAEVNRLAPYYELFLNLDKHERKENQLDRQIHNVYNQHNLQSEVLKQFDSLYNHPKVPFLKHL